jgi:hypothetical protein
METSKFRKMLRERKGAFSSYGWRLPLTVSLPTMRVMASISCTMYWNEAKLTLSRRLSTQIEACTFRAFGNDSGRQWWQNYALNVATAITSTKERSFLYFTTWWLPNASHVRLWFQVLLSWRRNGIAIWTSCNLHPLSRPNDTANINEPR